MTATAELDGDLANFEVKAAQAANMLKLLANERRLLILCELVKHSECTVNNLADAVGLSQSALSQHLAKMRAEGLVAFRRSAQTLHYRIADKNATRILTLLQDLYC